MDGMGILIAAWPCWLRFVESTGPLPRAKLGDFGLARSDIYGPPGWFYLLNISVTDPPRVSNFSPQVCFWWLRGSKFRPLEDSGTHFLLGSLDMLWVHIRKKKRSYLSNWKCWGLFPLQMRILKQNKLKHLLRQRLKNAWNMVEGFSRRQVPLQDGACHGWQLTMDGTWNCYRLGPQLLPVKYGGPFFSGGEVWWWIFMGPQKYFVGFFCCCTKSNCLFLLFWVWRYVFFSTEKRTIERKPAPRWFKPWPFWSPSCLVTFEGVT